jgi:hypothetical protein
MAEDQSRFRLKIRELRHVTAISTTTTAVR